MKPFLISLTSMVSGVEKYLTTLPMLENSVEPTMVTFEPQPPQGYLTIIPVGLPYPGNLNRFNHFPVGLKLNDMCIFTDAGDVIFQKPIPKLENKIYVCPEYAKFDETSWFTPYHHRFGFTKLDGKDIYNMGTWAMPYHKVCSMITFIMKNKDIFPNWGCADQSLYNIWLQDQEFEVHPTLMTCLFNSYATKKAIKTDRGWCNPDGELFSIIHFNGNTKELL